MIVAGLQNCKNKFLLFEATDSVVICASSHRRLIHRGNKILKIINWIYIKPITDPKRIELQVIQRMPKTFKSLISKGKLRQTENIIYPPKYWQIQEDKLSKV